jgi:hypothetical protein
MKKVEINYPSTPHFKEACSMLYRNKIENLHIHGTIKLHGANFGMILDGETEQIYFQSRNNILEKNVIVVDNEEKTIYTKFYPGWEEVVDFETYRDFARDFSGKLNRDFHKLCFFGEFVGNGVQKGVAVDQLDKMFVIFDVAIIESKDDIKDSRKWTWINGEDLKAYFNSTMIGMECLDLWSGETNLPNVPKNLYCIENFLTWDLIVNVFDNVAHKEIQNTLQAITEEVEKECPFAKAFGVSGVGEGVVWKADGFRFKVKGDEHTTSKVRTLNPVELAKIEQLKTINEFADAVCTEARLKQGLQYLKENFIEGNPNKMYVDWIIADTFKEEIDFITEKNLDHKELKKALGGKARNYLHLNMVEV